MKKIFSILTVIVFVMLAFVGCGKNDYISMANAPAIGNGGLAVAKGEYIYFVNGYSSKNDNLNKNKEGSITKSGIYRIKTCDASYQVISGSLYFKNGTIESDDNGNVKNAELIVSKVCGFENTSLYIFGDYLYYTTPNNEYSKNGTVYVNDIDFCRVRLDGKENKKLGTISVDEANYSKTQFCFYNVNSSVYFASYNGNTTLSINKIVKNSIKNVYTCETATNVILPKTNEDFSGKTIKNLENTIFFTSNKTLFSFNLSSQKETTLKTFSDLETFEIIGNNGDYLYYKITKNSLTTLYYNNCPNYFNDGEKTIMTSLSAFTSFNILESRNELVAVASDKLYLFNLSGSLVKSFSVSSAEIVGIYNENIFYTASNNLYQINLLDITPKAVLLKSDFSLISEIKNNISFTNEYVYYYRTIEEGKTYLQMINYKFLNENGSITVDKILGDLTK